MIRVLHIPEQEAVDTTRWMIQAAGVENGLTQKWIKALRKLGYVYRPDLPDKFSRPGEH